MNRISTQEIILDSGILTATGNNIYLNGQLVSGRVGVVNIGAGSGIYSGLIGNSLQFKTLVGNSGILISGNGTNDQLHFFVTGINGGGTSTTASNIGNGSGVLSGIASNDLKLKTLIGGSGIQISGNVSNDSLTFLVTGIAGGGAGTPYDPYTARYYI